MKQFFLYCLFGGLGVSTDFGVFSLLNVMGANYQLANLVGYASGTLVSFVLNRRYTFSAKDKTGQRLVSFFLVAGAGYLVSAALLWWLVSQVGLEKTWAKLLTLPVVVVLQFTLNKAVTFRETTVTDATASE